MEFSKPLFTGRFIRDFFKTGTARANYSYLLLAQISRAALSVVLMGFLARYLGVAHFGLFSYAIAFGEFFSFLYDFGLSTIFIRNAAASLNSSDATRIYSNALTAQILMVLLTYLIIELCLRLLSTSPEERVLIRLLSLTVGFTIISRLNLGIFRIFERLQFEAIAAIFERLGIMVAVGIAIWLKSNFYQIALTMVFASLGSYLFTLWLGQYYFLRFRLTTVRLKEIFHLLRQAAPLAFASVFSALKDRGGIFILQWLAGSFALGLFSAAYRLVGPLYLVGVALQTTFLPIFARLSAGLEDKFAETYRLSLRFAVVLGFILQTVLMYAAIMAIPFIYGQGFQESLPVLQILSLTIIPNFGYLITVSILIVKKRMAAVSWLWMITGFSTLLFSWLLCPSWGANGLAWSLVLSEFLLFICSYFFVSAHLMSGKIFLTMGKCGAVSISTMIIFTILRHYGVLLTLIVTSLAYIAGFLVLKVINLQEVNRLSDEGLCKV